MARRFFGRRRFLNRPRVQRHWTARQFNSALAENLLPDLNSMIVVDVPDYQGNTVMSPSGVTMVRCIINASFYVFPSGTFGGDRAFVSFRYGLCIVDKDQTTEPDPGSSPDLIDERWLHVGERVLAWGVTGAGSGSEGWPVVHVQLDIRQRARLRDQNLIFAVNSTNVLTPTGNYGVGYRVHTRTLLAGSIT